MYGAREPPVETMQALLELLEADQLFPAICANRAALGWPVPKTKQVPGHCLQDEADGPLERVLHHRQPRGRS